MDMSRKSYVFVDGVKEDRGLAYRKVVMSAKEPEDVAWRKEQWKSILDAPDGVWIAHWHVSLYAPRPTPSQRRHSFGEPILRGHVTHSLGHWER